MMQALCLASLPWVLASFFVFSVRPNGHALFDCAQLLSTLSHASSLGYLWSRSFGLSVSLAFPSVLDPLVSLACQGALMPNSESFSRHSASHSGRPSSCFLHHFASWPSSKRQSASRWRNRVSVRKCGLIRALCKWLSLLSLPQPVRSFVRDPWIAISHPTCLVSLL